MISIIFAGSPEIAVKSLEFLNNRTDINVSAVLTQSDKPKGRGYKLTPPPVKTAAEKLGIRVLQTSKISADAELISTLKNLNPDFIVTFAFGQILTQEVLDIPKFAVLNMHASLLPEYRGANPIQRCLFDGKQKTGITAMITELALDAGDICLTDEIQITENMTDIELSGIISEKAPELIYKALKGLYNGSLKPQKQPDNYTTAKKFTKEDALINWAESAEKIHNQVRSMVSAPNAYTFFNGRMLKILETRKTVNAPAEGAGIIIKASKDGIEVNTGSGSLLITKLKPESKGIMNAYDFANGAKIQAGMKFGK